MLGKIAILLLLLGGAHAVNAGVPDACQQLVLVVTAEWESTAGEMSLLEKGPGGWARVGHFPVTVGHRGLGIGLGLHPPNLAGPVKREGDHRAPAGIFRLESAFGTGKRKLPHFPYRPTDAQDRWVDDPASAFYNQWVRLDDSRVGRDWKSAEVLRREDGLYELALVVAHNRAPVTPGRGSAIFMHRWYGPGRSTIGCTAMAAENLRDLAKWLDAAKEPILVQVPRALLDALDLPAGIREAAR